LESAHEEFNVFAYFKRQEEADPRDQIFIYQGPFFKENFVSESRCMEPPCSRESFIRRRTSWTFGAQTLTRPASSYILWDSALRQFSESLSLITIAEICGMATLQKDGSDGFLLTNGEDNVFFAVDAFGDVRIVHVRYSTKSEGWGILSWPILNGGMDVRSATLWQPEYSQIIFRKVSI